ncbi:CDP-alcohol phosphatidyltransferase family protein [Luedemannella helvata]
MRLVKWAARHPWITPNRLTAMAFTLGCLAAACFAQGSHGWLLAGAGLYYLSFVIDCMDGKLARLMGTGSIFGMWLDFIFDRLLVVICTVALMGGQYARTDNVAFVVLGGVVIFLNLFRYVNGQTMVQAREQMRRQLEDLQANDQSAAPAAGPVDSFSQLSTGTRDRLGRFLAVRDFLTRHRMRAQLVSAIEFQMAIFILGPALDAVMPVTIIFGSFLLLFELAMIFQFWLSTRTFNRQVAKLRKRTTEHAPVIV